MNTTAVIFFTSLRVSAKEDERQIILLLIG
jgi:hypothetical protein